MRKLLTVILCFSLLGCDANLFSEMANRDTKEAIMFDAKRLMCEVATTSCTPDWDGAITLINSLSATDLAEPEVQTKLASAYAGRCGLNFVQLVLGAKDYSSSTLFKVILEDQQDDPDYTDCVTAQNILYALGDETERSTDQNLLMALVSLSKIGAILAGVADTNDDGIADPGYSACGLSNALTDEILVGISHFAASIQQIDSLGSSLKTAVTNACASPPPGVALCTTFDTASVDPADRDPLRTLIHNNSPAKIFLETANGTTCP